MIGQVQMINGQKVIVALSDETPVDIIQSGNAHPVTSNAVADAVNAKLGYKFLNSYGGMTDNTGADNVWIRTTSQGIIPYQSGGKTAGHCSLGTSTWYFAGGYVQNMYVNKINIGSTTGSESGDLWIS